MSKTISPKPSMWAWSAILILLSLNFSSPLISVGATHDSLNRNGTVVVGDDVENTSSQSADNLPIGLSYAISEAQGAEQDSFHFVSLEDGFRADNTIHNLRALYRDGTMSMQYGDDTFALSVTRFGYASNLQSLSTASERISSANRLDIVYDNLTEWYINGTGGIQQGFTITERPTTGEGLLEVAMTITGSLTPSLSGNTLNLQNSEGVLKLTYSGLMAFDANGDELPVSMRWQDDELVLTADDTHAVYPVTIDPATQEAKLLAIRPAGSLDGGVNDQLGWSVSISGDTAVVGARIDDDIRVNSGSAYVFIRSGSVWSVQAKLTANDAISGQGDQFGYSVSVSGDTVVIGAPYDDELGGDSGSAYVFVRSGSTWSQQQKLTASDAAAGDQFGWSVSISGDTAVIGARRDDVVGSDSGSAYVFVRSGSTWSQQQKLTASDAFTDDEFGTSVSVSGDTAVIGSPFDNDAGDDSGSAYVFVRSSGTWTQQQKLTAGDAATDDLFGWSVSVSGDTAAIGARWNDDAGSRSGSAYVFVRLSGTWTQQQKLTAGDAAADDNFGFSVSVSGDTAVISAYQDDDAGSNSGSAYVFVRSSGTWSEQQKLTASDGAGTDEFAHSVSVSGDTVVIGARFDDDAGSNSGSAYVFVRSGSTWSQQQKVTALDFTLPTDLLDGASTDNFGESVSISGDTAVVGARFDDDGANASGSVYVFVRSGGTWLQQQKLNASDAAEGDYFGSSVSLSGDTVIIGARGDNDPGTDIGSAYIFVRSGGTWTQQQKLTASDGAVGDEFGYSVSLSGDTVVIGARWDDDAGGNSGSAYVFVRSGGTWTQQQKLTANDAAGGDLFGYSVSLSGDTAVIGAYGDNDAGGDSGSAYVFVRSGSTWTQQQKLTANDAAGGDLFGWSVSVLGDTALIGAPRNDDVGNNSGSAYVFVRSGGTWSQQQKLTASDGSGNDNFGHSVSVSGNTVIIGARLDNDAGNNSGSAYVFVRSGGTWSEQRKLAANDAAANDEFGWSVSLSGNVAVIGAPFNDDAGSNSGSAYIFGPIPTINISGALALNEGDSGLTSFDFTVTADSNVNSAQTVNVSVAGSGANPTDATDFGTLPTSVIIADGTNTATISIPVNGDTDIEPDEIFTVTISAGSAGIVDGATLIATGTITDDDAPVLPSSSDPTTVGNVNNSDQLVFFEAPSIFVNPDGTFVTTLAYTPVETTSPTITINLPNGMTITNFSTDSGTIVSRLTTVDVVRRIRNYRPNFQVTSLTWNTGTVNAGQTVTATLSGTASQSGTITAILNGTTVVTNLQLVFPQSLPATGETPTIPPIMIAFISVVSAWVSITIWRRCTTTQNPNQHIDSAT